MYHLFQEYKRANKLAIVGFAPTTRQKAPYKDYGWDMFGLNEALLYEWFERKDPTGWFQIHPKWDFMRANNRNDPHHWDWLRQRQEFPIYMQAQFREVPSSVKYPLEEAMDLGGMYLTSSPAYMFALGILMGYDTIGLWGIEMSADSEYAYQKPCMEYWMGIAKGLGIEVYVPPSCGLLRGNLYGYEDLRAADRTYFGQRRGLLEVKMEESLGKLHHVNGKVEELEQLNQEPVMQNDPEVRRFLVERYIERSNERIEAINEAATMEGRISEMKDIIRWHDMQNVPADREWLEEEKDEQAE